MLFIQVDMINFIHIYLQEIEIDNKRSRKFTKFTKLFKI
jgi:hypothetical protein